MKKNLVLTLFLSLLWLTGSAWAQIDCRTQSFCRFVDETSGAAQPGLRFEMTDNGTVHIQATVFSGYQCEPETELGTLEADLDLLAGPNVLHIDFDPPLAPETPLGIKWNASECAPGTGDWLYSCTGYITGVYPLPCGS